jgi:hypothetical protein
MVRLRLPATPEARATFVASALKAIAAADAGFDSEALLRALPFRFSACGRALATGEADRLRRCLTPALVEQWEQGEALPASRMAELWTASVEDVRLMWGKHGPDGDRLVVGIDCLGDVGGELRTLTEYWTLVRPAGAKTSSGPLCDCPDCGAPGSEKSAFCKYCGSALGPLRGWLLQQVDEEVDWCEGPFYG